MQPFCEGDIVVHPSYGWGRVVGGAEGSGAPSFAAVVTPENTVFVDADSRVVREALPARVETPRREASTRIDEDTVDPAANLEEV